MTQASPLQATNLWALLEQRVKQTPSAQFLIDAETQQTLSFKTFYQRTLQLAAVLSDKGVGYQTTVAWQLPTSIDSIVLMYALSRLGAIQAPIIHLYRDREVTEVLLQSQPSLFIVVDDEGSSYSRYNSAEAIIANLEGTKPNLLDFTHLLAEPSSETHLADYQEAIGEERWHYYTSGTTARPKGTRHTDQSVMAGGFFLADALEATDHDVGSVGYPIAHIGGVVYTAMCLRIGIPIVLLAHYTAELVVSSFRRYGVTLGGGSTAHYQLLLDEQRKQPGEPLIPSLRLLSGGGAAKPAALFDQVKNELGVKIVHAYGMTEAPITSSNSTYNSDEQLTNSDGKPMPELTIKIINAEGQPVAQGEAGEILLRGPNLCQGYLLAEQTEAAFDAEGFYHTGDIGLIRDDGHIAITGRLKEIIIRKGENISAREIEELLNSHDLIKDTAVIGLPDEDRGELVCAVVELNDPATEFTMAQMQAFLLDKKLMKQKIPERLEVLAELPRNKSLQKVQKNLLVEQFS